jgi:hypothetical protein
VFPVTIAALLVPDTDVRLTAALDRHRIAYEESHGPTDLTRYYTSRWPRAEREKMMRLDFKKYFDGLPEFFQDFLSMLMQRKARDGALDDMHEKLIQLYCSGGMRGSDGGHWAR